MTTNPSNTTTPAANGASTNIAALKQATPPARPLAEMKPKEQIAYLLSKKKDELAKMLPKTLSIDRLLKVAQIAATTTPALAKCDVPSLVGAIGQCAQMGLEPNTVLGHAYLVPFNTKRKDSEGRERWVNSVQVIIGYKGLIDLARRSGQIVSIAAHEVCANDRFELVYGLDEKLNHVPAMGERGDVIGFYAVAKLKDGGHSFEFMSAHQVLQIRDASQGWQQALKYKTEGRHPWSAHFVEMGRKTVIRRLAKYLPLSIEFQTAVALDTMAGEGKDQSLNVIDGEFTLVPESGAEDGSESAETIDHESGEITGGESAGSPPVPTPAPPPAISQQQSAGFGDHIPPPAEQRETVPAGQAASPAPRTRRATAANGTSME